MKIRCSRAAIQEGIQTVGAVASQRSIKEILQYIRMRAADGSILLEATDFDTSIRYRVEASVEEGGTVVVPASRVTALFREVVGDEVVMAAEPNGLRVTLGGGRFRVPVRPEGDFPDLPGVEGGVRFRVARDLLADLVKKTQVATGDERTRYAFDAVKWLVGNGSLRMASTDGKRMSYVGAPVEMTGDAVKEVLVQARGTQHMLRAFAPGDEAADVAVDDFQVAVRTARAEVYVRLTEGNFPEFGGLLQKKLSNEVLLERASFERCVRSASIFAGSDSPTVVVAFRPNQIVLSSGGSDSGDAEVPLDVEYAGAEVELAFNPQYLLELLKVVDEDHVRLEFDDTNTAARFRVGENFTHVIMPISREYVAPATSHGPDAS